MLTSKYPRIHKTVYFIATLLECILLGWSVWHSLERPDIGFSWSFINGKVDKVNQDGPAAGLIFSGDHILTVDNTNVREARLIPNRRVGDIVHFTLERGGQNYVIAIPAVTPSFSLLVSRLSIILVALAFGVAGIIALVFRSSDTVGQLFFLFCQVGATTLTAGAASATGPVWIAHLFSISLWWLGTFTIHFHLYFPNPLRLKYKRVILSLLYTIALVGTASCLITNSLVLEGLALTLYMFRRLWLVVSLTITVILLIGSYRKAVSDEGRQKIRLVVLGNCIGVSAFIGFFLLPDAFLKRTLLPYDLSLMLLVCLPLSYSYAIHRYRLIKFDYLVNRSVTYLMTILVLGIVGFALYFILTTYVASENIAFFLVINLICVSISIPLYHKLSIMIDLIFYGKWYDYQLVIQKISQPLDYSVGTESLAKTFVQRICDLMHMDQISVLLWNKDAALWVSQNDCCCLPSDDLLNKYFHSLSYIPYCQNLCLDFSNYQSDQNGFSNLSQVKGWIPLLGLNQPIGVLAVSCRPGEETINSKDWEILQSVAYNVGMVLQNAQLVDELRQRTTESIQLHQQVLNAREQERKRIAQELHDQTIQSLIGINYHLANLGEGDGHIVYLQDTVREVIRDVRQICADLRPPALDSLGLISAVRSKVRDLEAQTLLHIRLEVEGDTELELPEEVALCAFRTIQETLQNIQKHAQASQVVVYLAIQSDWVHLRVSDNGQGFDVPSNLGVFMKEGCFGLIGLRERLDAVKGTLKIDSDLNRGTWVEAQIPVYLKEM